MSNVGSRVGRNSEAGRGIRYPIRLVEFRRAAKEHSLSLHFVVLNCQLPGLLNLRYLIIRK